MIPWALFLTKVSTKQSRSHEVKGQSRPRFGTSSNGNCKMSNVCLFPMQIRYFEVELVGGSVWASSSFQRSSGVRRRRRKPHPVSADTSHTTVVFFEYAYYDKKKRSTPMSDSAARQ